ncbi:MAG: hypothetical protein AOA65_1224 [Candidatus Bathyarchaeota archaeon BA1]|nr:MAG: hypothetical protein AOA65_1224 [Candidatus Bathyarchaeota archaeon BA1]
MLGCSGWHYKDWVGPLYRTAEESKLAAYSKIFKTVEIDSTFYAYPSRGTVMGWLKYTKPDFVYTAKLPRLITHKKKLNPKQGVEDDLERFCELMEPLRLGGKLGCLLIQCPPGLSFDLNLLGSFFGVLPSDFRFAIEFRDPSWLRDETWKLLERYRVAYTIVDEPLLPPTAMVTTDIAYMRWHGRGKRPWYNYHYKVEELEPWIPKVKEAASKAEIVYGYFNNHYHGYAVENCLQVLEMLGVITPEQAEAKQTVEGFFEVKAVVPTTLEKRPITLTAFMPEKIDRMEFQELLHVFMDGGRVKRAKGIKDKEVAIQEVTDDQVRALIREYHLLIDLQNRAILHDCADWSRCIPVKQFCKHVGKVMMLIPREMAVKVMRKICLEREGWEFKPYVA